jgi:hypothetical protein
LPRQGGKRPAHTPTELLEPGDDVARRSFRRS